MLAVLGCVGEGVVFVLPPVIRPGPGGRGYVC